MDGRAFCGTLAGRLPASVVLRDDRCTAFLDIQPVNEGHVLVVPNNHVELPRDLPDEDGAAVFRVARKVAATLYKSAVRCEGVTLRLADGEVAGQEVPHVHLHVIPGFEGDGAGLPFGPVYEDKPDRNGLEETARCLKGSL